MKRIGFTGGIGMGKSTVAQVLASRAIHVVDTDEIARDLVEPGHPALDEIVRAFGNELLSGDGRLKRGELARRVFADVEARSQLEAILHPRIRERWQAQMENWRSQGCAVGVVVIPLLFETGAEKCFDRTACVACAAPTQRERLRQRGWDDDEIARRIAAQLPAGEKIRRADYVIWSEGGMDSLQDQLQRIGL
jgi:dephospho-CoA kinase